MLADTLATPSAISVKEADPAKERRKNIMIKKLSFGQVVMYGTLVIATPLLWFILGWISNLSASALWMCSLTAVAGGIALLYAALQKVTEGSVPFYITMTVTVLAVVLPLLVLLFGERSAGTHPARPSSPPPTVDDQPARKTTRRELVDTFAQERACVEWLWVKIQETDHELRKDVAVPYRLVRLDEQRTVTEYKPREPGSPVVTGFWIADMEGTWIFGDVRPGNLRFHSGIRSCASITGAVWLDVEEPHDVLNNNMDVIMIQRSSDGDDNPVSVQLRHADRNGNACALRPMLLLKISGVPTQCPVPLLQTLPTTDTKGNRVEYKVSLVFTAVDDVPIEGEQEVEFGPSSGKRVGPKIDLQTEGLNNPSLYFRNTRNETINVFIAVAPRVADNE